MRAFCAKMYIFGVKFLGLIPSTAAEVSISSIVLFALI